MNSLFLNSKHQESFDRDGYFVTDTSLNANEIDKIKSEISQFTRPVNSDLFFSLLENNYEDNKRISEILFPYFSSLAQKYCKEYRINTPSFLIKPANTTQELFLHQDWNYVDETEWQSATIWLPLVDTDKYNGGLFVMPGSHLFFNNFRSNSLPTSRLPITNSLLPHIKKLNVEAGQVVLFHPALFHGSFPNVSESNRIVITAILLPANAPFLHYTQAEEVGMINQYVIEEDSFIECLSDFTQDDNWEKMSVLRSFYVKHFQPTEDDLLQRLINY